MVDTLFLKPLNMSIAAGWMILAVIVLRILLKNAPKYIHCILWGIVGLRLICPFSFESVFSLIPSKETLPAEALFAAEPTIQSGVQVVDKVVNPAFTASFAPPDTLQSVNPLQVWVALASYVWILGMIVMLMYAAFSYLRVRGKLKEAVKTEDDIWQCDHVETPFILGIFRPRIYLPSDMAEVDIKYVLAHERAHLKRRDHWWKPLAYVLLTVYWFHPLCWIAYALLCRDIELACDEKVIKNMDIPDKKGYSTSLLTCSVPRRMISACPLAFGEVSVKERVKGVLNYKRPAFWVTVAGVICCVVAAVCFLTNPKEKLLHAPEPFCHSYRVKDIVFDAPWYSFTYLEETAPLFSFSADYVMMAKEEQAGGNWFQIPGGFEEIKLSKDNFDAYFKALPAADGPTSMLGGEFIKGIRKENEKAWRMDVSESLEHVLAGEDTFYYLLYQEDDGVYLVLGYEDAQDAHVRWLFELERIDLVDAKVYTEGMTTTLGTTWYPDGEFDFDYDALTEAVVYGEGTIELEVDFECDSLIVGEDYYEYTADFAQVHRNTYELSPNAEGKFELSVSRKGSVKDEQAVYYVETPNGKSVFKVLFPINSDEAFNTEVATGDVGTKVTQNLTLEEAVHAAIIEHNKDSFPNGDNLIYCASHTNLGTLNADATRKVDGKEVPYSEIIVYALTRYQVYSSYGGELTEEGGCAIPAVISFEQDVTGAYELIDYKEPRDGSYYKEDIESMFPKHIVPEVHNAQAYADILEAECLKQAEAHVKKQGSLDAAIEQALEEITFLEIETLLSELTILPLHASMPQDYSQLLEEKYQELIEYDVFTLRYCFEQFLQGSQTDLRGQIMAQACQDIIAGWTWSEESPGTGEFATGQDWFDAFLENAHELKEQYKDEPDILEKYYPATWLLLEIESE